MPHKLQSKVRIAKESFFGDFLPQAEHVCEVFLGSTWWKWKPSLSAMSPHHLKKMPQDASEMLLLRVLILNHVRGLQVLRNEDVLFSMVKKFVNKFTDKVFTFVSSSLLVIGNGMHGPDPAFTPFFAAGHRLIMFVEQSFCLAIPARVIFLFAFGSR